MGNDANFFNTINTPINLKRNILDSYDKTYIDKLISNHYTIPEINTNMALQLDASIINFYYDNSSVDNLISALNVGLAAKASAVSVIDLRCC